LPPITKVMPFLRKTFSRSMPSIGSSGRAKTVAARKQDVRHVRIAHRLFLERGLSQDAKASCPSRVIEKDVPVDGGLFADHGVDGLGLPSNDTPSSVERRWAQSTYWPGVISCRPPLSRW